MCRHCVQFGDGTKWYLNPKNYSDEVIHGESTKEEMIKTINQWATCNIKHDLIFYIKLNFETALQRVMLRGGKLTSFETEKELFWKRVNDGFNTIFENMTNVVILDGQKSIEQLTEQAVNEIIKRAKAQIC